MATVSDCPVGPAELIGVAREAGRRILDVYSGEIEVDRKDDDSPLTEADRRSHDTILAALADLTPDIPVLSEESAEIDTAERLRWDAFWLVDPLDGTKEFIKRNGEFTVNIAYVRDGTPLCGVVHMPVGDITYWTDGSGVSHRQVADRDPAPIRRGAHYTGLDHVRVIGSRSHRSPEVDAFVRDLEAAGKSVEFQPAGSSLKFCRVAEGLADVYPRMGPTMEWDTAAAHAVAVNAGCQVLSLPERAPLLYNKESLRNPWFVVE